MPAKTLSPTAFSTGIDTPVMAAWSTAPVPTMTSPSTGTFAPFLTRTVSPTSTAAAATST